MSNSLKETKTSQNSLAFLLNYTHSEQINTPSVNTVFYKKLIKLFSNKKCIIVKNRGKFYGGIYILDHINTIIVLYHDKHLF